MKAQRGFTLVEVVIAIFIAMLMFAIGYRAINQALLDRDALMESQARVTEIQRAMRVIAQDFAQIADRAARDVQGNGELFPAISSSNNDNIFMTFTRGGWSNPAGLQRPAEQRVRYRFLDGSLIREHWMQLDAALNTAPMQRVLLTRVKLVEVRYLDPVSRDWRTDWPIGKPSGPVPPTSVSQLLLPRPLAIEFTLELEDWGRLQRLFEIPT